MYIHCKGKETERKETAATGDTKKRDTGCVEVYVQLRCMRSCRSLSIVYYFDVSSCLYTPNIPKPSLPGLLRRRCEKSTDKP